MPIYIHLNNFNPILAYVWFTQNRLGEDTFGSTLIIWKKLQICKISNIYCKIKLFRKIFAKSKKCAKYDRLYIFDKPSPQRFQTCKNICKISKTKFVFKENRKWANSLQKSMQNLFLKIVQSASICSRLSKSYKKSKYNNRK